MMVLANWPRGLSRFRKGLHGAAADVGTHAPNSPALQPLECVMRATWRPNAKGSLRHHHLHKLLVVDLAVTINIGLTDHLVDLLICEFLSKVRHHMAQLGGRDKPV